MTFRSAALALLLAAGLTAAPAVAQQQQPPAQTEDPSQSHLRGEQWYEEQLTELAQVLGGAHYLRILCQGRGDQRWRDYMRGVIEREPEYNNQLVEGFNRGYRDQEARFPVCDTTAQQTEAELRARGLRVSRGLSARHAD